MQFRERVQFWCRRIDRFSGRKPESEGRNSSGRCAQQPDDVSGVDPTFDRSGGSFAGVVNLSRKGEEMPNDDFDGLGLDCCGPLLDFIQSRIEIGDTHTDVASAIDDFEASLAYLESLNPDTPVCLIEFGDEHFHPVFTKKLKRKQAKLRNQIAAEEERRIAAAMAKPKKKRAAPTRKVITLSQLTAKPKPAKKPAKRSRKTS